MFNHVVVILCCYIMLSTYLLMYVVKIAATYRQIFLFFALLTRSDYIIQNTVPQNLFELYTSNQLISSRLLMIIFSYATLHHSDKPYKIFILPLSNFIIWNRKHALNYRIWRNTRLPSPDQGVDIDTQWCVTSATFVHRRIFTEPLWETN